MNDETGPSASTVRLSHHRKRNFEEPITRTSEGVLRGWSIVFYCIALLAIAGTIGMSINGIGNGNWLVIAASVYVAISGAFFGALLAGASDVVALLKKIADRQTPTPSG